MNTNIPKAISVLPILVLLAVLWVGAISATQAQSTGTTALAQAHRVLTSEILDRYVEQFNGYYKESIINLELNRFAVVRESKRIR